MSSWCSSVINRERERYSKGWLTRRYVWDKAAQWTCPHLTGCRGAWMSSIVVDGSSQIKLIHSKGLIPSRWLGGWIEFHKIGVWVRSQWAPFSFRADGGTGALGAGECGLCRAQGTGHVTVPQHRQGQEIQWQSSWLYLYILALQGLTPWVLHRGAMSAFMLSAWCRNPTFCRHQGEILLCFLCGGLFLVIPLGGTAAFGGWLVPHHRHRDRSQMISPSRQH